MMGRVLEVGGKRKGMEQALEKNEEKGRDRGAPRSGRCWVRRD